MTHTKDDNAKYETWIASALESLGLAMLTVDTEGRITRINENACGILEIRAEIAVGQAIGDVVRLWDSKVQQPVALPLSHLLQKGTRISAADGLMLDLVSGGKLGVNISAAPLKNDNGDAIGAVLTLCPMDPCKITSKLLAELRVRAQDPLRGITQTASPQSQSVYVRSNGRYIRVMVDDLLWVEAMENYVQVQTTKEKLVVHTTLKSIAEALALRGCQRIHRSFIVKVDAIESIEEHQVIVAGTALPIGKSFRAELLDAITLL